MRVVIQRVREASVTIDGKLHSAIGSGMLILIGVEDRDNAEEVDWLVKKVSQLRIFDDDNGVMNRSVVDVEGEILVVSQFTLHASTKKGNRPSYIRASRPEHAIPMYELFCRQLSQTIGRRVEMGVFGADMQVALINDGPVTICIDSLNRE
ncbi:MAG: D-tyrosyl-tRNA(Tyr) deacylase [Bacteroidaceae bacterium]|nr:D-tyrosyl-tRNA(Tyr) deacylase [Bacteroidaceae bacterium]